MICLPDPVQPVEQIFRAVNAKGPKEHDPSFLGLLGCRGLVQDVGAVFGDAANGKAVHEPID